MLKKQALIKAILSSSVFLSVSFSALSETVIIVNPNNDSVIDAKVAQRIFLGKEGKFSNGKEAIPVNQIADSPSRTDFDTTVLGRSSAQVSAYWSKLVFTGKGIPPKEVQNDAEVIALVADNQDAIGYVDSAAVTGNVKAIPLN
ncbi:phosphate ABC transporter substrate-binding protein [Paraglaciecola sp.]|uniref:phosphate ABC transporter substrate-binding protein n=1 Tax=Paraglaciecola sp. TaxID=1920173 RepID=UPI00273CFE61|nr:phosphate ABC transporter substrate-binding protein [Paraglaciecola sp.]MDP5032954.1 phosphate ABC transporter substrate-binding protein [Paraglaciecola sp.]